MEPTPSRQAQISKTKTIPPPLAREAAVTVTTHEETQPKHVEVDPFRLLLPVEAVPTLPDEVICLYDNVAVDMEKNIKKVVRKLLKKNKTKLEEFKVNSRLYGTDFMDAHAYLDTLIKDFGPIRALQLVPCLLSIQPNLVKSNDLLLTAKNYLLRHEEELERELQSLQVPNQMAVTNLPNLVPTSTNVTAKVAVAESAATNTAVITLESYSKTKPANASVVSAEKVSSYPVPVDQIPSPFAALKKQPTKNYTTSKAMRLVEPMPEPQEVAPSTVPPLINIAVSASQLPGTTPTPKEDPIAVVSDAEFRAENLFGETITPSPLQHNSSSNVPVPISPTSSTRSFEEAENLFGERLPSPSRSNASQRKTVTWGDAKTMENRVKKASPVKAMKKPAPLLFGLATAAAFDSDSDESDCSAALLALDVSLK
ncbi:hypothetical protein PHMEG_0001672 [Phytophthora megakarya]|uniref:ZNF598/HEL2 PAH domain-containing protein n=1 Tax=Phytophthora megakarya TaxID=4795 RepID=A0A225X291_9STRA|nr:hypothetical protein PHMEG_0001672 [Phytophthora megakarya]